MYMCHVDTVLLKTTIYHRTLQKTYTNLPLITTALFMIGEKKKQKIQNTKKKLKTSTQEIGIFELSTCEHVFKLSDSTKTWPAHKPNRMQSIKTFLRIFINPLSLFEFKFSF